MKKTKSLKKKAKNVLRNRSTTYNQRLSLMANGFSYDTTKQQQGTTSELEIDIALSCLNACKYGLIWIVGLCLYSSI
ncbi:hypothetical protein [Nostoc sp. CCY0012]|uniref:hypothetical protein n=1 Tax=Nostoc sp. CCY0012 TaxID=1056123 RepID=UPI0039C69872